MASRIEAISAYRPRVKRARTNDTAVVINRIAGRTGLNAGEIKNVLTEFNDTIIEYARQGISVKIEGLGTFSSSIALDGDMSINLRKDVSFAYALNVPGFYIGEIIHSENIGKSGDELVALWDADHPDDTVIDD